MGGCFFASGRKLPKINITTWMCFELSCWTKWSIWDWNRGYGMLTWEILRCTQNDKLIKSEIQNLPILNIWNSILLGFTSQRGRWYYFQPFHQDNDSGPAGGAFRCSDAVIPPGPLRLRFPPDTADSGKIRHRRSGRFRAIKQAQMPCRQAQ